MPKFLHASPDILRCRRFPFCSRLLATCLLVWLLPLHQQSAQQNGCRPPHLSVRSASTTTAGLGISFADAALCSVNICVNGTCYENGGLQVCVCDKPYTGPLCTDTPSMCNDGCGIRKTTGIDCASALCSLGACSDTNTPPYFKCDCGDFFVGDNCETHSNPCTNPAANPCGFGTCFFAPGKGSGTVTCTCEAGYETAKGADVTIVKWGNSEVIQSPPCIIRQTRGLADVTVTLSSGELIIWWTLFGGALLLLVWCCFTVFTESCGRWASAFKAARAAKNATGA